MRSRRALLAAARAARRRGRRGRGSAAPCPCAWPGRCASGTTPPAPHALASPAAEVVEPGLADHPDPRGAPRSALDLGIAPPSPASPAAPREPRRLVGVQRDPAEQRRVLVDRLERSTGRLGRSQPICTIAVDAHRRGVPRSRRPRRPARARPSRTMSRWVWLSTTGSGSGSGAADGRHALTRAHGAGRLAGQAAAQLLVDDRRVELGEDRRRLGHRRARHRPARDRHAAVVCRAVVAGDDRVAAGAAVEVVDLLDARHRRDHARRRRAASCTRLRAVRQERRRAACCSR